MEYLWYGIFYSALGYGLEKAFAAAVGAKHRLRRCFVVAPLCPVYGLAMLAVLLLGAALCWFCAEGALSRRAALGEGTAAAALPALRTVMAAAVAYTAVYRFCTLFAMEPYLQGMNPSLYYTVSHLVQFWM